MAPSPASAAGPAAIQRATSARSWPRRRASVQTSGSPSCSDAMPPHACAKSPLSSALRSAVEGEWSDTTRSIVPSARPAQSASRLASPRTGGQHLNGGRAVRHVLGPQHQVVRAGLDGQPHAVGLGGRDHRQRARARQVHARAPARRSRARRRRPRRSPSPRPRAVATQEVVVRPAAGRLAQPGGVLGVHEQQPVRGGHLGAHARQPGQADRRELLDAGVGQEALHAEDPGTEQLGQPPGVARHRAAPEADVDEDLSVRGCPLRLERGRVQRRRDAVERHVDDGGHPAGRRGPRRGREALPLGAARLVDVHVGVDQARQQHLVVGELDHLAPGDRPVERTELPDHRRRRR